MEWSMKVVNGCSSRFEWGRDLKKKKKKRIVSEAYYS